jgi:deoxyribonuclease-4
MLGSNVPAHPSRGGLATLFRYADEWSCECAQTYITLSRRWNVKDLPKEEILKFKSAWKESKVQQVVAHVPLIVNLASRDHDIWQKSKDRLVIELSQADALGVKFLVLHPGYHGGLGRKEGLSRIVDTLNEVSHKVRSSSTMVLLETMAGQGTSLGSRFEELAYILERVEGERFLGVCFDTCHVFAAGYDIRGYEGYRKILEEFNAKVGLDRLRAVHLNDCKAELGCKVDRHAFIGQGKLGLQVFHSFVRDSRFSRIPKVLELPTRDGKLIQQQLRLLRELQATSGSVSEPKSVTAQLTLDKSLSSG